MVDVRLPELGEGVKKATIACWHARIGDQIKEEDDLVELVTDKASFNVPANATGILEQVCFSEGDEADIGATLAMIKTNE